MIKVLAFNELEVHFVSTAPDAASLKRDMGGL